MHFVGHIQRGKLKDVELLISPDYVKRIALWLETFKPSAHRSGLTAAPLFELASSGRWSLKCKNLPDKYGSGRRRCPNCLSKSSPDILVCKGNRMGHQFLIEEPVANSVTISSRFDRCTK